MSTQKIYSIVRTFYFESFPGGSAMDYIIIHVLVHLFNDGENVLFFLLLLLGNLLGIFNRKHSDNFEAKFHCDFNFQSLQIIF